MTYFYINNGNLYASEVVLDGEEFIEITEQEYNNKLSVMVANREVGLPSDFNNSPF